MMRKVVATARTVVIVPLFFVLTLILAGYFAILARINPLSTQFERIIQWWSVRFLRIPPITVHIEGAEHIAADTRYVVISNHLSNFDIPLLFHAVPTPIRFLAKKELYRIPLLGLGLDAAGIVKIDRQHGMSTHEAINAGVAEAKQRGFSLMVFAEGTRSRDGEMGRFYKGAFRIAIDNELPLVPVVIHGTHDVNPPGEKTVYPGKARVVITEPIDTTGMTSKDDLKPLLEVTVDRMTKILDDLRADDQS